MFAVLGDKDAAAVAARLDEVVDHWLLCSLDGPRALRASTGIERLQQHLKERLTGAAIIVLVVVLLVPEMFRGRPALGSDSHASPADGAPMRSYTIDLRDSPTAQPPAPLWLPPTPAAGSRREAVG